MYRLNKDHWDACSEAIEWLEENNIKTLAEAWEKCERGDWLLWLYVHLHPDHIRERTLVAGLCANTVRHHIKDKRSIVAVDAAIAFGEGKISECDLRVVVAAAEAAAVGAVYANNDYAYASYASYASYAACISSMVGASYYASYAACYAAVVSAAREENQLKTANICRKYLQPIF